MLLSAESNALQVGKGKVVKVTGIENPGRSATVLLRGSNKLVLEVQTAGHSASARQPVSPQTSCELPLQVFSSMVWGGMAGTALLPRLCLLH